MSGFANAVVGGMGNLVRKMIQSPNYAQGVSGWIVNQDGSAEFNDAVFRGSIEASNIVLIGGNGEILVYSGTPAAGNLIAAISGVAGVDSYGNAYGQGLTLPGQLSSAVDIGRLNFPLSEVSNQGYIESLFYEGTQGGPSLILNGPSSEATNAQLSLSEVSSQHRIAMQADCVSLNAPFPGQSGTGLQFGSGPAGLYYAETVGIPGSVIVPNNSPTRIGSVFESRLSSDYGSCFNGATGLWTCPVSGWYDHYVSEFWNQTASGRMFVEIMNGANNVILARDDRNVTSAVNVIGTYFDYFNTGDTVYYALYQNSGVSLTTSNTYGFPHITVARRL